MGGMEVRDGSIVRLKSRFQISLPSARTDKSMTALRRVKKRGIESRINTSSPVPPVFRFPPALFRFPLRLNPHDSERRRGAYDDGGQVGYKKEERSRQSILDEYWMSAQRRQRRNNRGADRHARQNRHGHRRHAKSQCADKSGEQAQ